MVDIIYSVSIILEKEGQSESIALWDTYIVSTLG